VDPDEGGAPVLTLPSFVSRRAAEKRVPVAAKQMVKRPVEQRGECDSGAGE
jgi:hypothetical protein